MVGGAERLSSEYPMWLLVGGANLRPEEVKVHDLPNPLAELDSVGHSGAQEDDADVFGQHDQHLLPHHSPLKGERGGGGGKRVDKKKGTRSICCCIGSL